MLNLIYYLKTITQNCVKQFERMCNQKPTIIYYSRQVIPINCPKTNQTHKSVYQLDCILDTSHAHSVPNHINCCPKKNVLILNPVHSPKTPLRYFHGVLQYNYLLLPCCPLLSSQYPRDANILDVAHSLATTQTSTPNRLSSSQACDIFHPPVNSAVPVHLSLLDETESIKNQPTTVDGAAAQNDLGLADFCAAQCCCRCFSLLNAETMNGFATFGCDSTTKRQNVE